MKRSFWGDKGKPGERGDSGTIRIEDLMASQVVALTRHQSVGHARELMMGKKIHCLPVLDNDGAPVGILTSSDLVGSVSDETLIGKVMTTKVFTIPRYASPSDAALSMRKHHIHHLVVTHEKKVIGVISSYDLLKLLDDRRFVSKVRVAKHKASKTKIRR